jgi:hypothetical protein
MPRDGPEPWQWLELPQANEMKVEVQPNGTIQGTYTRQFPEIAGRRLAHDDVELHAATPTLRPSKAAAEEALLNWSFSA